jgi:Ca2+-dependent lipid-binding protein
LQRFWVQFEPALSTQIKAIVDPILSSSKPGFLDELHLAVFTLGSTPPRIELIRTVGQTPDDVHIMELDLNFTPIDEDTVSKREMELGDIRTSRIEIVAKLGKGLASIPLPILVKDIEFRAKVILFIFGNFLNVILILISTIASLGF